MIRTCRLTVVALLLSVLSCSGSDEGILWQAPGAITLNDWIWGAGGEAKAPQPPFEFSDEDPKGTNPKIRVLDAKGDRWIVKFGGEIHGEIFASRFLHALGYVTEPSYYVASGSLSGVHDLKRAKPFISRDGAFRFARFKLQGSKRVSRVLGLEWSWTENPFVGSRELNGLKILMMLMSNWDGKDSRDGPGANTEVYSKFSGDGYHLYYAFTDWGATLGNWGGFFTRDKWNPEGYERQTKHFVSRIAGERIEWGYRGKHGPDITSGISLEDVRWLMTYLSPVTDEELRAGLRASGATEAQIGVYSRALRGRIAQLQRLIDAAEPTATAARGRRD